MKEKIEKIQYPHITPPQFEQMLLRYGMKKADYCKNRGVSRAWFHNVLRIKEHLTYKDIQYFIDDAGLERFSQLCNEILPKTIINLENNEN